MTILGRYLAAEIQHAINVHVSSRSMRIVSIPCVNGSVILTGMTLFGNHIQPWHSSGNRIEHLLTKAGFKSVMGGYKQAQAVILE